MAKRTDRATRRTGFLIAVCAFALTALLAAGGAQASSTASAAAGCPPGTSNSLYCAPPQISATMEWTFFYAPRYTRVLSLAVNGASHDTVVVTCHGHGCPYRRRTMPVASTKPCGKNGSSRCPTHGDLALNRPFKKKHLAVGTKLSVAIVRSGWIGKYYVFKVRAGHAPKIAITCLAPGSSVPSGAC